MGMMVLGIVLREDAASRPSPAAELVLGPSSLTL
jgi:hypothetical protein